jgi:hypothetical protein
MRHIVKTARHSSDRTGTTCATPNPAGQVREPRPEELVSWTCREWFRCLWYRLRLTVQEMNYASRRMVELQMRLPPSQPSHRKASTDQTPIQALNRSRRPG